MMRAAASRLLLAAIALTATAALAAERATHSAAAVPSCAPASLSASFGGQGATQSLLGGVTVTNHAQTACRLSGRPLIAMRGGSPGEVLREQATDKLGPPGERFSVTLVLDPRHTAAVWFQWLNWCNPRAKGPPGAAAIAGKRPTAVLVRIAPGARQIVASVSGGLSRLDLPVCGDPSEPSQISVSLWSAGG